MRNIHRLLVILSEITLKLDCKISIFFGNHKVEKKKTDLTAQPLA